MSDYQCTCGYINRQWVKDRIKEIGLLKAREKKLIEGLWLIAESDRFKDDHGRGCFVDNYANKKAREMLKGLENENNL